MGATADGVRMTGRARTGAGAGRVGYVHETAFYGSDAELVDLVVPFVRGGATAGEPTIVTLNEDNAAHVRGALGDAAGITFIAASHQYARPASAIAGYRQLFAELVAQGAAQIRVVGDVPHPGTGYDWDEWARYEAVVNHAFDDFPVWGLCPYDTRVTPPHVLDEVARTHPLVATAHDHRPNPAFEDPRQFLAQRRVPPPPAGAGAPLATGVDLTPPAARREVARVCDAAGLAGAERADLLLAVSETVANAREHGAAPMLLEAWAEDGRVIVTITDHGAGPADPFVGLVPPTGLSEAGRGLWIAHQLGTRISLHPLTDGFTVALVAGERTAAA